MVQPFRALTRTRTEDHTPLRGVALIHLGYECMKTIGGLEPIRMPFLQNGALPT